MTDGIDEPTAQWIARQPMFFVATAPSIDGTVNVSPKGLDTFRVVSTNSVAYLDLTGSGAETIAHLRDNGRITFMFCAFDGAPRIVRLFGRGIAHLPESDQFDEMRPMFPERRGVRSIVAADIHRVQDSCGYSVPKMDYAGDRSRLETWTENRTDEEIVDYWREKNAVSIDGLPALGSDKPDGV